MRSEPRVNAFIAKFDNQGNQLWLLPVESVLEESANGIATDHLGNIFICGRSISSKEGTNDAFIAKYADNFSVTQHHYFMEARLNKLSKELQEIKTQKIPNKFGFQLDPGCQ